MRIGHRPTTAAVALGSAFFVAGLATPAVAACDAYSNNCPTVVPSKQAPAVESTSTEASTLPFTGGELVLMTAAGIGALAGGTALVVAGRRRAPQSV